MRAGSQCLENMMQQALNTQGQTISCQTSPPYTLPLPSPAEHRSNLNTPWMPLEGLIEVWSAFGREASTSAALEATNHAFAALAAERTALHLITRIHQEKHQRQQYSLASDAPSVSAWFHA